MKKIDYKEIKISPADILFASTSDPDYEMSRVILLEQAGKYIILEGGHCSCYGFDDTEWSAIEYEIDELKKLPLDYGREHAELKVFIERYF